MAKCIKVKFPSLKGEMAKRGISVSDLAEVLDSSEDSVRRRLRGDVEFDLTEIIKILDYFQSTFEELFGEEDIAS